MAKQRNFYSSSHSYRFATSIAPVICTNLSEQHSAGLPYMKTTHPKVSTSKIVRSGRACRISATFIFQRSFLSRRYIVFREMYDIHPQGACKWSTNAQSLSEIWPSFPGGHANLLLLGKNTMAVEWCRTSASSNVAIPYGGGPTICALFSKAN